MKNANQKCRSECQHTNVRELCHLREGAPGHLAHKCSTVHAHRHVELYMCMCGCIHLNEVSLEEGIVSSGAEVTGVYRFPNVGLETKLRFSTRSV